MLIAQEIEPTSLLEFARLFGFNAVVIILMMYGTYRIARFYLERVAIPLNDRLIASVDHTDKVIEEHTAILIAIRDSLLDIDGKVSRWEMFNERLSKLESTVVASGR